MAKRKYKRLHYEDRQTIEAMSKQGSSVSDIAEVLGTHRDTIYREFKRCNATLKTVRRIKKKACLLQHAVKMTFRQNADKPRTWIRGMGRSILSGILSARNTGSLAIWSSSSSN